MARKTLRHLTLAGLIAAGCGDATGPTVGPEPVRTDSFTYRLARVSWGYDAAATITYTNSSAEPVFFARCGGSDTTPMYSIQRSDDSTLSSVVGYGWACVGGVPTGRIGPGETLEMEVWLGSAESPRANPPILMEHRTGKFRIYLDLCSSYEAESADCVFLEDDQRSSNVFEILPP